ncbi:hypothetical protein BC830DRAFT_65832 [Chytriomyces sp. MP71]|nr:hypothetical protein BC830DRAFT_65832 [Chytriomyces sp. MP71]
MRYIVSAAFNWYWGYRSAACTCRGERDQTLQLLRFQDIDSWMRWRLENTGDFVTPCTLQLMNYTSRDEMARPVKVEIARSKCKCSILCERRRETNKECSYFAFGLAPHNDPPKRHYNHDSTDGHMKPPKLYHTNSPNHWTDIRFVVGLQSRKEILPLRLQCRNRN